LIVRRVVFAVAALAAIAAAAGVLVVSASFAVYQALRQVLTPAEAGAAIALAAAILCGVCAVIFAAQIKLPKPNRRPVRGAVRANPIDQIVEMARERPFVAAGAAAAAGLLAFANPALVTAVMRAFINRPPPRR
jgi:hypothetical protein